MLLTLLVVVALVFVLQFLSFHVRQTRKRNGVVRSRLFKGLQLPARAGIDKERRVIIGFFHPYCNAGGGGERVLWQAVEHHLRQDPSAVIVIYSGDVKAEHADPTDRRQARRAQNAVKDDYATKEQILTKCNQRFAIPLHSPDLARRIAFLPLSTRYLVSDSYWNRLTLLGQAYGSMRMAFEACSQLLPDVFIDTMGYGFAYPVVRLFKRTLPIGAYIHYPMISTDMLQRVKDRKAGHTNAANVSGSRLRSTMKLNYYRIFAMVYSAALRSASVRVANGSWTRDHVDGLVFGKSKASEGNGTQIVYPPCDTTSLAGFVLDDRQHETIVSLAQFRPEKEHATQIRILAEVIRRRKQAGISFADLKLICMGSSRDAGDERRIEDLKRLAKELDIKANVSFIVNAPFHDIQQNLASASIGLSTMVDEHFGINVVEFMVGADNVRRVCN